MKQVEITITYRLLERVVFILIILLLLFLLVSKYVSEDCGDTEKKTAVVDTKETTDNSDEETEAETETEEEETQEQEEEETTPEPEPEPEPTPTSDELVVEVGKIDFDVQEDGRAKINNIKISVNNGLSEDVLLFANLYLTEPGNDDLELYNPVWNQVQMPLVKAGKTELVTLKPSKTWPPGVKKGSKLLIDGEFFTMQGDINQSDSTTQTV